MSVRGGPGTGPGALWHRHGPDTGVWWDVRWGVSEIDGSFGGEGLRGRRGEGSPEVRVGEWKGTGG